MLSLVIARFRSRVVLFGFFFGLALVVPEIVEEVARRSLRLAQSRFEDSHRTLAADQRRLDEVKLEERNLIREIAKLGTSDEFYEVLRELREEKAAIQARIEAGQPEWSPASLETPVRAAISQIELLLQASPEKAHLALERLLRGNRITVHQSPGSRDYHIEGTAELTLEAHTAGRPETTGRMLQVVAGARSDRLHTAGPGLLVRMQFSS